MRDQNYECNCDCCKHWRKVCRNVKNELLNKEHVHSGLVGIIKERDDLIDDLESTIFRDKRKRTQ